jgi:hypothetical protein
MAKRLRDNERRKLPSYRKLSFKAKGILTYLEDNCDSSGLWPEDFEAASRFLGVEFTEAELPDLLGDRVWKVNEELFFIPSFFEEQYGDAKDTFNAKRTAVAKLQSLGLMNSNGKLIRPSPDTHSTVDRESTDSPGIGIGIVSSGEGGVGEGDPPTPEKSSDPDPLPSNSLVPDKPPAVFGPRDLAAMWNERMATVKNARGKPMALVDIGRLKSDQERWKLAKARIAEEPNPDVWRDVVDRIARSEFCRGKGAQGDWTANFMFLVRPKTFVGVLEGDYGCSPSRAPPNQTQAPPDFIATPDPRPDDAQERSHKAEELRSQIARKLGHPHPEGA